MNDYEEVYIDTVSYSTYERDLQQKDSEIDKLQDENYQLQVQVEKLEQELEDLKNAKKITFINQRKIRI